MIAFIEGKIVEKDPTFVIIDINGVGYEMKISLTTYTAIKEEENYKLHTYLHVREDAQILFGFAEKEEKKLFLNLISISGVGPNTGLMVLSSLSATEIKAAIVNGDAKTIQSVKGIGAKTAQRIILELRDKIAKEFDAETMQVFPSNAHNTIRDEALSALVTLGFNKNVAEKSIDRVLKNSKEPVSLEELIKLTLKST